MVLERLHVAALLAVEVFRGPDRDLQPQDRLELLDRLGVRIVDHEEPEPLLEQVRILPPREVEPGVKRGGLESVMSIADPLDLDLSKDRQIGASPRLIQSGQAPRRVVRALVADGQVRPGVAVAGEGQERPEQVESHRQEVTEDGLLDLVDRLLLVGGTAEAFDEGPEGREGPIDGLGTTGLFGGGVGRKLDGECGGGKHGLGSSPMRDILGHRLHPGMYRVGGRHFEIPPIRPNTISRRFSDTCGNTAACGISSYTLIQRLEQGGETAVG